MDIIGLSTGGPVALHFAVDVLAFLLEAYAERDVRMHIF